MVVFRRRFRGDGALFKEYGCHRAAVRNTGCQMGGWFRKEINRRRPQGAEIRIGGMAGLVLAKLGVVPSLSALRNIYPRSRGHDRRRRNGWGPTTTRSSVSTRSQSTTTIAGFWEGGPMLMTLVNEKKWNELPKPYQAALTAACGEVNSWMPAKYDEQNPQALRRLIASGTTCGRSPDR